MTTRSFLLPTTIIDPPLLKYPPPGEPRALEKFFKFQSNFYFNALVSELAAGKHNWTSLDVRLSAVRCHVVAVDYDDEDGI